MTEPDTNKRRRHAAREGLRRARALCPDAEFVVVSASLDVRVSELDMTCVSSVVPHRAIELLEFGIDDFKTQEVVESEV